MPRWQIIELPGLADLDPSNVNERFLEEESIKKKIVKKVIKDESTVILSVISALDNITDCRALDYVREYDPAGNRTMGILTKYDLVQDANQRREASKLLAGGLLPLKHGYFGINPNFSRENMKIIKN